MWYLYLSWLEIFCPFLLEGRLCTLYRFNYTQINTNAPLNVLIISSDYPWTCFYLYYKTTMIFFFTIFKCDNLTNVLNIIIINLEKLLVGHIRIIVFDPKENMTQITTPSTEYFHFILNLLYYATHFFFYIFNTDLFLKYIYFWLHWVFVLHAGFL